jgi:hypothetical protein
VKKHCNFCGEPMPPDAKECKQCGWDVSLNAPPTTDAGDRKARIGVAAGLVVAYVVMWTLISGTPAPARAEPTRAPRYVDAPQDAPQVAPQVAPERTYQPASSPATSIATPPVAVVSISAASTSPDAPISIKVADTKKATIPARDALQYVFGLPDTDQKCRLVGSTKGIGGFGRNIEVFLLTDADYDFWNANPAAIAPSHWETYRGSENTLNYELSDAGTYHFVVSNQMSPTPQTMAVKMQVKCVK